jgi:excisionase family DNA binding protein
MKDLLTTRQLQEMLQVDRVTIYRMLEDGRLRGFKVGGQWRFHRQEIERWLEAQRQSRIAQPTADQSLSRPDAGFLPSGCIQAVQDIFAEACEVATLICTADGSPATRISQPCSFCQLLLSSPEGERRCRDSRRQCIAASAGGPAVVRCHAGLSYVTVPVKVDGQASLYILAGQFWTRQDVFTGQAAAIERLAAVCDLPPARLVEAAAHIPVRDPAYVSRISRLGERLADTIAELGQERSFLLRRLKQIAEMTMID